MTVYTRTFEPTSSERGAINLVTLAITLPVLLLLIFSSIDLFLYFRAVAVVERAAAEAAQAVAAAEPGSAGDYVTNSLPAVDAKTTYLSYTGGNTHGLYSTSFANHGWFYAKASSALAQSNVTKIPFDLETQPSLTVPTDGSVVTYTDGVHYLPRVQAPVCVEPMNQTINTFYTSTCRHQEILYYSLPTKMDFDGDGREDIAFFDPNSVTNFWIHPSSGGSLFKNAIEFRLRLPLDASDSARPLPCPADYDGDGKTDFCIMSFDNSSNIVYLSMALSSTMYYHKIYTSLSNVTAIQVIPVPGQWGSTKASKDTFALLLVQGESASSHLSTWVYPEITADGAGAGVYETWTFTDTPTKYDADSYKPQPSRHWRPVFADHDGNGTTDIGWLTWDGGYEVFEIAGAGAAGITTSNSENARDAKIHPWGLFYPPNPHESQGLFIVERYNHRVGLISNGSDKVVNADLGGNNTEQYLRVAGAANPSGITYTTPNVDPLSRGRLDYSDVPTETDSESGCSTCSPGGAYDDDSSPLKATAASLNSPRAVYTKGGAGEPLYIADFGNYRIRRVDDQDGDSVDGQGTEGISTIAGGVVGPDVACPEPETMSPPTPNPIFASNLLPSPGANPVMRARLAWPATETANEEDFSHNAALAAEPEPVPVAPAPGDVSLPWNAYSAEDRANGIHPTCVRIRPVSLVVDEGQTQVGGDDLLIFGDEQGAIFVIKSGDDGGPDGSSDERMYLYSGKYGSWGFTQPAVGDVPGDLEWGVPHSMSLIAMSDSERYLAIGMSSYALPVVDNVSEYMLGGIVIIEPGDDDEFGTADDSVVDVIGSYTFSEDLPQTFTSKSTALLSNPTDLVFSPSTVDTNIPVLFATGWENTADAGFGYERSLIRFAKNAQWINNPATIEYGIMPSSQPRGPYEFDFDDWKSISTVPVEPTGGVAISPNGEFLYIAETARGMIQAIALDRDSDGTPDDSDSDIDGDSRANDDDVSCTLCDPYVANFTTWKPRATDAYHHARMWAVSPHGSIMDANGTNVTRLEWFLDRFTEMGPVPDATTGGIPGGMEAPFVILNDTTLAYAAPRQTLHGDPVWSGGSSIPTELNGDNARLTPMILGNPNPNEYQVKAVSGHESCSDWRMDENSDFGTTTAGAPKTTCDHVLSDTDPPGYTLGLRRAFLGHWDNQWIPLAGEPTSYDDNQWQGHLVLLDVDGAAGRDAAVFVNQYATTDTVPFMVYMRGCFTELYETELNAIGAASISTFGLPFGTATFYQGACLDNQPFMSAANTTYSMVAADYHAEWDVKTVSQTVSYSAVTSERLSMGTDGDGDPTGTIGPVGETAYRILEQSLRVDNREKKVAGYDATVEISMSTSKPTSDVVISVNYNFPLSPFMKNIYGADFVPITRTVTERLYNHGAGS